MSVALGLARLHPSSSSSQPHYVGYSTARTVADDTLFEAWNGTSDAAKKFEIDLDGRVRGKDGTVAKPTFGFIDDTDSGMYRIGADNIGLAVNGAKVVDIATTGVAVTGTLSSSGALTVTSGGLTITAGGLTVTAGNVAITAGTLTASNGGSLTGTWSNLGTVTTVDINGGTVDGAVIGGSSAAAGSFTTLAASSTLGVTGVSTLTGGVLSGRGSSGAPGYAFTDDTDTGFRGGGSDTLQMIAGGGVVTSWTTTGISVPGTLTVTGLSRFNGGVGVGIAGIAQGIRIVGSGVGEYWDLQTGTNTFTVKDWDGTNLLQFNGSTDAITVAAAATFSSTSTLTGNVGIGRSPSTDIQLALGGTHGSSATSILGMGIGTTAPATATGTFRAIYSQPATVASAFTMSALYGFYAYNATKGSGSTITTQYGLYVEAMTSGGTNYAIYTNGGLVRFGGATTVDDVIDWYGAHSSRVGRLFATDTSNAAISAVSALALYVSDGSVRAVHINATGAVFVGDTANANMTVGLTLNQGAADNQIFAGKSSDVATGLTSAAGWVATETDDFFTFSKVTATGGGLAIQSLGENAANTVNMTFASYGGQASTTHSAAGRALVEVYAAQHDGANALANIAADGNVFGVRARVGGADTTLWLVDEDGDTWQAGGITATTITGDLTGDVTGNADTATALATARTIGGASFNGTANITVASATGGFTVTGGALEVGTTQYLQGNTTDGYLRLRPDSASTNGIHLADGSLGLLHIGATSSLGDYDDWNADNSSVLVLGDGATMRSQGSTLTIIANGYNKAGVGEAYMLDNRAGKWHFDSSGHFFGSAPIGTAGNAITWSYSLVIENSGATRLLATTDPSTTADYAHIYAKDVTASAEIFVRDEGGTVTQISPHDPDGYWYMNHTVPARHEGRTMHIHVERWMEKVTEVINELADAAGLSGIEREQYFQVLEEAA